MTAPATRLGARAHAAPTAPHRPRSPLTRGLALVAGLAVALAGALALAPAATAAEAAPASGAWVRAAHLVPELGAMEVALVPFDPETGEAAEDSTGAVVLAPAATYGAVAEYQSLPAGLYTMTVRPAGSDPEQPALLSGALQAREGGAYTVAGLGTKDLPRVTALEDDLTPPAAGSSRVRLLHGASATDTVTVTAVDGPTVATNAAFAQPTGYADVPAGPWTLDAEGDGVSGTTEVDLAAGGVYTLLVLDGPDDGLVVTAIEDAAGVVMAADDSTGAQTMPVGGAATGGGFLADDTTGAAPAGALAAAGVLGALLLGGALLRRRSTVGA